MGRKPYGRRPAQRTACILVLVVLAGTFTGCDGFMLGPLLDGEAAEPLSITPASTVVAVNGTVAFVAAGGIPPYTFSVVSGEGSVDTQTGVYTAPPVDGDAVVSVVDLVGNSRTANVAITVPTTKSIDYRIDSIAWATGTTAGQPVTGSFVLTNIGEDNGTHDIGWQVFASVDTTIDFGSDHLVDRGTHPAVAAGVTADPIDFSGVWPSTATTYYLIALIATTPDDPLVSNNDLADSGTAVAMPPAADVDYTVGTVSNTGTPAAGGSAVAETFAITNDGPDSGVSYVFWNAYISTDSALDGTDVLIDFGYEPPLSGGGGSTGPIPIDFGSWPIVSSDTTYYLIVEVSASDELVIGNNVTASGAFTITAPDLDYWPLIDTPVGSPADSGSAVSETFTITNDGPDTGASQVFWNAYISLDMTVDGGDDLIDSGAISPPAGGGGVSASVPIDSGQWPTVSSDTTYYLLVDVSASDEPGANTGNNGDNAAFTINRPDVDYIVTAVSNLGTPVATSGAISEQFEFRNTGLDNGSATVSWDARISADAVYSITDLPASSGSVGPLAATTTSAPVAITGSWPDDGGEYYLVVRVSAADDNDTTNNDGASGLVEVNAPLVDYTISNVTNTFPSVTTNSGISESFIYRNSGGNSGTLEVSYTAYVHTLPAWDSGDPVVGTEALGAGSWLVAGSSSGDVQITGFWPASAGNYYLTIEVSAGDNSNLTNDTFTAGPFTVNDPPDYSVAVSAFPVTTYGGNLLESAATASSDHGGSPLHQILITEEASEDGLQDISWTVYQSMDQILDGLDTPVDSGVIPRLLADDTATVDVNFLLPPTWGYWYYIVTITAGDDPEVSNNTATVGPVAVWQVGDDVLPVESSDNAEFDTDEDDIFTNLADDFAVILNPGDSVFFNGLIDQNGFRDSFIVRTGPDTGQFQIRATWDSSPPKDNIDLHIYDETGSFVDSSLDIGDNMEPDGGGYWTVPGVTPNSFYYVDAISLTSGDIGDNFSIQVIAGP